MLEKYVSASNELLPSLGEEERNKLLDQSKTLQERWKVRKLILSKIYTTSNKQVSVPISNQLLDQTKTLQERWKVKKMASSKIYTASNKEVSVQISNQLLD